MKKIVIWIPDRAYVECRRMFPNDIVEVTIINILRAFFGKRIYDR